MTKPWFFPQRVGRVNCGINLVVKSNINEVSSVIEWNDNRLSVWKRQKWRNCISGSETDFTFIMSQELQISQCDVQYSVEIRWFRLKSVFGHVSLRRSASRKTEPSISRCLKRRSIDEPVHAVILSDGCHTKSFHLTLFTKVACTTDLRDRSLSTWTIFYYHRVAAFEWRKLHLENPSYFQWLTYSHLPRYL